MTLNHWHRPRSPAFIGGSKLSSRTNRKGWNHLKTESCRMVVVDQDDYIWLGFLHPLLGKFISSKEWLPVRFLSLALIQGSTNCRDMRSIDGSGNIGHVTSPWLGHDENSPGADDELGRHRLHRDNGCPRENAPP